MTAEIPVLAITLGLLGGLAVFLLGLDTLTKSLQAQSGEGLRRIIGRLTVNRGAGFLTGMGATVLLQSSSITTVVAVGLVSGGLLTFSQSLGVVLGANVGTTVTAQIVAFDTTLVGLALVMIGYLMARLARSGRLDLLGSVLLGLGLVFVGMDLMTGAVFPLRTYDPFLDAITTLSSPILGILAGAVFTALVQSSTAATGVAIALATAGVIPLDAGVAVIVGANIGTCVTAGLAAIGKPPDAVRTAVFHVVVNLTGALVWAFFLATLADVAVSLAPSYPGLEGVEQRAAEVPRQLAMAHTVFNVSTALALISFLGPLGRFVERLVPDHRPPEPPVPRRLDPTLLVTPWSALEGARQEIGVLGAQVLEMLDRSLDAVLAESVAEAEELDAVESAVDARHLNIVRFLRDLEVTDPGTGPSREIAVLLDVAGELEGIADTVSMNLLTTARERIARGIALGADGRTLLAEVKEAVSDHLGLAITGAVDAPSGAARAAAEKERSVSALLDDANRRSRGLLRGGRGAVARYALVDEVLEQYRRIYDNATRIVASRLALEALDDGVGADPAAPDEDVR